MGSSFQNGNNVEPDDHAVLPRAFAAILGFAEQVILV
jgi:hypothetical protein